MEGWHPPDVNWGGRRRCSGQAGGALVRRGAPTVQRVRQASHRRRWPMVGRPRPVGVDPQAVMRQSSSQRLCLPISSASETGGCGGLLFILATIVPRGCRPVRCPAERPPRVAVISRGPRPAPPLCLRDTGNGPARCSCRNREWALLFSLIRSRAKSI